eukprot:331462_1
MFAEEKTKLHMVSNGSLSPRHIKYFMLMSSSFLFANVGQEYLIVICQSVSMLFLLLITFKLCVSNLFKYGLTQNEPYFPYGASMIRILGFVCGVIGCVVQILI